MVLTPSTTSSGIAGFTFWSFGWLSLSHLSLIGQLFHLPKKLCDEKHVFRWILAHKAVALVFSETINFIWHGSEGAGVVFALGGTLCNATVIFMILPLVNRIKGPQWLYGSV